MDLDIPQNIDVIIRHNHGEIHVTLEDWIRVGPGPRIGTAPIKAINRITGNHLPLEIIPLPYRNNLESIQSIIKGKFTDPWNRDQNTLQRLKDSLERMIK